MEGIPHYDTRTYLPKADVSKAGNSSTAARTASPSLTASSSLGAYNVCQFQLVLYLNAEQNIYRMM